MRIAAIYDFIGWAWWHRAHNIKKNMPSDIEVVPIQATEVFDVASFDYVMTFSYHPLPDLPDIPPEKLILGISDCSDKSFSIISEMFASGQCKATVANNIINFERLLEHGTPVFLCQNGVDTSVFHPCKDERPSAPTACWVGNPNSLGEKGLDLITEACTKTGIKLVHQACIPPKTKAGSIPGHEHVRDTIYWKANFYICASRIEGTPNPALEAMACGLPVLSTRVGNMSELIDDGHNGYFVSRSVESISQAIERLRDADLHEMGYNAKSTIDDCWTWAHQAKKYTQMFRLLG